MNARHTYLIRIGGQASAEELNATSPLRVTVAGSEPAATLLSVSADQSGLIGLLRHLHGLGFVLLSVGSEGQAAAGEG